MKKSLFLGSRLFILLWCLVCPLLLWSQPEISGISVSQKGDTTIFQPQCGDSPCPTSILNDYLFAWDLGDCSKGYGNVVRHVYTQAPKDPVALRAAAIYDEDEDPDRIQAVLTDPKVIPLPAASFRMKAEFSCAPVPDDWVDVAVTLDQNFAPGTLTGDLIIKERSRYLDKAVPDTLLLRKCGKLSMLKFSGKGKTIQLDSLFNLADGPTTLLFRYRIPAGLEPSADTVSIEVRFSGSAGGGPVDTTIVISEAVKGSHDPNTKTADPPEYFLPGDYITYTIHFQNIGTGPAKKVVISDFLDSLFDLRSVRVLNTEIAGEPKKFEVKIVDRQLIFRYKGKDGGAILPAASIDPEGSQGLVRFKVRTRDTIGCFDHIANAAAIVFDQNPAFVTPCVVHKRFCGCQEYCQFLRWHGSPRLGERDSVKNPGMPVEVLRTGAGSRVEQVKAQPWDEARMALAPAQGPAQEPAQEPALPYMALLVAAGAVILILLVLYIRK